MSSQIEELVRKCSECIKFQAQWAEPLKASPPTRTYWGSLKKSTHPLEGGSKTFCPDNSQKCYDSPTSCQELGKMEEQGVISRVEEPMEWCAGMVVVPKSKGRVRICVDLTKLNPNVLQERHILPAVEQTLAQVSGARVFSSWMLTPGFGRYLSPKNLHGSLLSSLELEGTDSTDSHLESPQPQNTSKGG